MLASRVQPVRAPEDESIVARPRRAARDRAGAAGGRRTSPEREAELRQRVRERAWQHGGSGEVADPVTLDELRSWLDDDTALIAYVVAADRLVALVVTADRRRPGSTSATGPTSTDSLGGLLPDLDVAASDLPRHVGGRFVREELAGRLAALADLLVAPVARPVGDRRVVLTPSGVLAGVPVDTAAGFRRPAGDRRAVRHLVAGPPDDAAARSATAGFVAGPRVARAEDEVNAAAEGVAGRAGPGRRGGDRRRGLGAGGVGRRAPRRRARAALGGEPAVLRPPARRRTVVRLRHRPAALRCPTSCCSRRARWAAPTVRWGEELIGMTTAWLHAGARCVIASPAAVNDRAAYDVLVAVHQRWPRARTRPRRWPRRCRRSRPTSAPVPLVCFG